MVAAGIQRFASGEILMGWMRNSSDRPQLLQIITCWWRNYGNQIFKTKELQELRIVGFDL
ncbi:hypothetical protein GCM10008922_20090 [Faecalicatena contorta]